MSRYMHPLPHLPYVCGSAWSLLVTSATPQSSVRLIDSPVRYVKVTFVCVSLFINSHSRDHYLSV